MIIKSKGTSIKAVNNLIDYIVREGAQLSLQGDTLLFKQHLHGDTTEEWTKEFIANEARRKNKNKRARGIYHCIISLHPKDSSKVTLSMLESIAREFVRLRCPESLVLCTAHQDEHLHLHLLISGVSYGTGESIRLEKNKFNEVLRSMAEFQEREYGELTFSKVDFGKNNLTKDIEYQMRLHGKTPEKQLAKAYVEAALESSMTLNEFCETLKMQGFEPYYRNGILTGVKRDKKYRFKSLNVSLEKFKTIEKSITRTR